MSIKGSPCDPTQPTITLRRDPLTLAEKVEILAAVRADLNPLLDTITLERLNAAPVSNFIDDPRPMWPRPKSSILCEKEWQLSEDNPVFVGKDGQPDPSLGALQGLFFSETRMFLSTEHGGDVRGMNLTFYGLARNGQWVIAKSRPITEFMQNVPEGTRCFKVKSVKVVFCEDDKFLRMTRSLTQGGLPVGWKLANLVCGLHKKVDEKVLKWRKALETAERILPRLAAFQHTIRHCS